jgi:hypothetical protein
MPPKRANSGIYALKHAIFMLVFMLLQKKLLLLINIQTTEQQIKNLYPYIALFRHYYYSYVIFYTRYAFAREAYFILTK